ncbi:MAG: tRNA 4-thiouridine(8) synthase ThiI [Bacilli bacterium]|nr:tRNA 4-thiouridine(8) synthase ThiI [Bacilli bacterium]
MKLILVKYGELTTKKDNRKQFIKILNKNIIDKLRDYNIDIKYDLSRMFIIPKDDNIEEIINKVKDVFGLHELVIAYQVNNDVENIKEEVLSILKDKQFNTFKINTKRSNKKYPIHSLEFNNIIGSLVLKNFTCKVDVHNPELLINIEIRDDFAYIYTNQDRVKAVGGYPVGIQGKGLLLLSGGIDSPVAGYLALKRGVDLECLYFESPPHTSVEAKNKVLELAKILNTYSGNIKVHVIPFTKLQEAIYKNIPETYMITILRRMMYRIAERVAKKRNCKILINGESIGQVASQTLTSMSVINNVTNMPVIRPVACFDKLEIIELSKKIGTYKTSILPYEDCCTIFVPKHPVINPELSRCIEYEKLIDYNLLIDEAVKNMETIKKLEKNEFKDLL